MPLFACPFHYSREGLTTARAALSGRILVEQRSWAFEVGGGALVGGIKAAEEDSELSPMPSEDQRDEGRLQQDRIAESFAEALVDFPRQPTSKLVMVEDHKAWLGVLFDKPLEYVDYAAVAKERVSAAHRKQKSDLQRGPACPVCVG